MSYCYPLTKDETSTTNISGYLKSLLSLVIDKNFYRPMLEKCSLGVQVVFNKKRQNIPG